MALASTSPSSLSALKDSCSPTANFCELLSGDTFTFFVGPEKKKYSAHVSLLSNISEPLKYMMTNGKMEESVNKEAYLRDVEPEIFGQLLQFAYQGICGISDGVAGQPVRVDPPSQFGCHRCQTRVHEGNETTHYPFCSSGCSASYNQVTKNARTGLHSYNMYCINFSCRVLMALRKASTPSWLCSGCIEDGHSLHYPTNEAQVAGEITSWLSIGPQFRARLYGCTGFTHQELSDHIERHRNQEKETSGLIQQAKLYVIANKYMIKDLQDIALHKIHRNLAAFELCPGTIDQMIDLMLFTYTNTSDGGDILWGMADKLRDLVMAYVADRAKDLMKYENFRVMLGAGGAQTADFMALMFP